MRALKYQNSNGTAVNTMAQAEKGAKMVFENIQEQIQKPTKEQYEKIKNEILSGRASKRMRGAGV